MPGQPLLTRFVIKKFFDIAALAMGEKSTYHGHWIYEKLQRPSSIFHEAMNMLYYCLNIPRIHRPISALIEPVYGCNLNCTYCWQTFSKSGIKEPPTMRPKLMPWPLFRQTAEQLPKTVESVCLTGLGEPLLHPDLCKMIEYLSRRHIRSIIYTNGIHLQGPVAIRLARSPVDVVNISVEPDSATAMTYRGVDNRMLYNNIAGFITRKSPKTEVKLSVVAHAGNIDRLHHVYKRWGKLTDGIKIISQTSFDKPVQPHKCPEPWLGNINILTNGDVGICCPALPWPIVIGNIAEKSLDKLINSPRHQAVLKALIKKGKRPEPCHFCSQFNAKKDYTGRRLLK